MRKWYLILALLIFVAFIGYNYLYQDHRDIQDEKSTYVVTSEELTNEFSIDAGGAESKYLNHTIEVSGSATDVSATTIVLDAIIFCQFIDSIQPPNLNNNLTIKGRFIGYDDLLDEIKLDQCHIINN